MVIRVYDRNIQPLDDDDDDTLCIRNDQQYALICTTTLFYVLSPTCFGSSLPSSGSFLDPSELLEIQIEWVVYLKYITDKKNWYV
jgi:hypothetical protein